MSDFVKFSTYLPVVDVDATQKKLNLMIDKLIIDADVDICMSAINEAARNLPDWYEGYDLHALQDASQCIEFPVVGDEKRLWIRCQTSTHLDELGIVLKSLLALEPEDCVYWKVPYAMVSTELEPDHFDGGLLIVTRKDHRVTTTSDLFDLARGVTIDPYIETL